jgi:hypothetical protein
MAQGMTSAAQNLHFATRPDAAVPERMGIERVNLPRDELRVVTEGLKRLFPVPDNGEFDSLLAALDRASHQSARRC